MNFWTSHSRSSRLETTGRTHTHIQNVVKKGHSPVIVYVSFAGRLTVLSNDHLSPPAWWQTLYLHWRVIVDFARRHSRHCAGWGTRCRESGFRPPPIGLVVIGTPNSNCSPGLWDTHTWRTFEISCVAGAALLWFREFYKRAISSGLSLRLFTLGQTWSGLRVDTQKAVDRGNETLGPYIVVSVIVSRETQVFHNLSI